MKKLLLSSFLVLITLCSAAQDIAQLYTQANNFSRTYNSKYYNRYSDIKALDNGFTCMIKTKKGNEFFWIDAENKEMQPLFNQPRLSDSLTIILGATQEPYALPFYSVTYKKPENELHFSINNTKYRCNLTTYQCTKLPDTPQNPYAHSATPFKEDGTTPVKSPDGKKEAFIREGNLWVRTLANNSIKKLSVDGSIMAYYSSNIYWSPDSEKIVCCKYTPVNTRVLTMIMSSPKDQLQPKIETHNYTKPGDALPVRSPVLFFLNDKAPISYKVPDVHLQYALHSIRWDKSNTFFTFEFNKRGHQQYIVYKADAIQGELSPIVNETTETFIYYDALYRYWFENTDELLWISERDGYRHLYIYDTAKQKVKKQLTKGEWIVKSVIKVNEDNRTILFTACGVDKNQDPYLLKYYSLNIQSGKITCLTPENANHTAVFTTNYNYMLDVYSRIDTLPSVCVRSVNQNTVVFSPNIQPDLSEALAAGYRYPETFVAKGRDGKTDIHGVIMRPTHFDATKKYPVIEYIYAGPHDSFVPKSFSINHWGTEMIELGFIVVQIDGMGTANRSKAFHDVCWKNIKDAGFPDRIKWIQAAAQKYPEMDIDNMGIYGCSAGGQSAMGALLFHPEFYKVAVAACGCHDNRMDKISWNEQWMGYPVDKAYEESSNVVNAHKLQGKLMLLVGELDNNVDPSSTLQVVAELIKHNKEFELVMLPNERHTMGGSYGERKRRDFFVKHLLQQQTPEWNRTNE